ncbi:MAG: radical SAM family heme chaperone HemW [Burkholderiaceae bacterium]
MADKRVISIVPIASGAPVVRREPTATVDAPGRHGQAGGVNVQLPLTLYVHLPWCIRKCPYCDFNSHQQPDHPLPEARYVDALLADLEKALPQVWGRPVHAIFFGGGTPSLFDPAQIDRLISGIRARLQLSPGAEITMEANPGTFDAQRFVGFAQAGVTRLSVGVQSFDDQALEVLGRVHNSDQALAALELARTTFTTYNLDTMFALPGQDMTRLARELDQVRRLAPPHWSCYHLTMEPNTYFANFPPPDLPDDDLAADMLDAVVEAAEHMQMQRYEVSAYAQQGHRCRHNLNYWTFGDYLGIGAGAHGKLSFHDRIIREQRFKHPERYMDAALSGGGQGAVELSRPLQQPDLVFEFMLNSLRLTEGVPAALFADHTGLNLAAASREMARAASAGLLSPDPTRIQATAMGLAHLNELQMQFLAD